MSGNPVFVESGRRGARNRWGPPRIARLDSLTAPQRQIVLALIDTMKAGPESQIPGPATTAGGTRDAAPSA
jgi:hypothetical protein